MSTIQQNYANLISNHEGALILYHDGFEQKYHPSTKTSAIHSGSLTKLCHKESYKQCHPGKYISYHDKGQKLIHSISTYKKHDGILKIQNEQLLLEIKRVEMEIQRHKDIACANRLFEISEIITNTRRKSIEQGKKATNCYICNYTCDSNCCVGNVSHCGSISNGYCTACPGKCHYSNHYHSKSYIWERYNTTNTRINSDMRSKYNDAKNKQSIAEQTLYRLKQELNELKPTWSCCNNDEKSNGCMTICNQCKKSITAKGCIKRWDCCDTNETNKGCKARWDCCDNLNEKSIGCDKEYICCGIKYPDINDANGCHKIVCTFSFICQYFIQ